MSALTKSPPIDPDLPPWDLVVLDNLLGSTSDESSVEALRKQRDVPVIFNSWNTESLQFEKGFLASLLSTYVQWARTVVRNPVDVVFLSHIILYFCTSVPSAIYLYYRFHWVHGILHWIMQLSFCGSFTLMLHNHIHNNGLLNKKFAWFDVTWPYVLEPLMGHTWDSYYWHHVKHHHVENNGPEDLSSTIRYQRDEVTHFLMYVGRFVAFIWIELPLYFVRKGRFFWAFKAGSLELLSYAFIASLARWQFYPTLFVFIIPLLQMRIGLMVGNYGQHALVDDVDPKSDFRSSITLIDVPSNRHCFNDGYHTSHHLNPLRHWRDHPSAFLKGKREYADGKALVFRNIDYLMMTYRLLCKDYMYLADRLVPIGDQVGMSKQEIADLLRSKTRRFSEREIQEKFYGKTG